jgi:arsenate reductase
VNKKHVLILCTGNSCRSQMAEGLINHFLGEQWEAVSAGTHPSRLNPYAIRAMGEIGIDISHQQSKGVEKFLDYPLDLVVTVCSDADQNCPIFPGNVKRAHIGFDDPANVVGTDEEIMRQFRRVRNEIQDRLLTYLKMGSINVETQALSKHPEIPDGS